MQRSNVFPRSPVPFGLVAVMVAASCGSIGNSPDASVVCTAPEVACGSACVDLGNDNNNCGVCGMACGPGLICGAGICAAACPIGLDDCSGTCVDTDTDDANCGGCGTACDPSVDECRAGICEPRCDTFLTAPVTDAWGNFWDQLERAPLPFDQARIACETFGGRIPTASEAFRVSTARSGLFDSSNINEIWTRAPHDATQQATIRLSTGAIEQESTISALAYRCVCPVESPIGFSGPDCAGPAGNECFSYANTSDRYHVDNWDRPAMRKNSAIWECAWNGAHLIDAPRLFEAILEGLPNGTDAWLHTADDGHYNNSTATRWTGAVTPATWSLPSNITVVNTDVRNPFRCAGVDHNAGAHPGSVAGSYTTTNQGYTADSSDAASATWRAAHDACWDKGGHLARSGELGELVLDGLPNGSNPAWLFTADQTGYDGAQFTVAALRWTGVAQRFTYSNGAGTLTWVYKHNNYPYRCVYYPIDAAFAAPPTCNGNACSIFMVPGAAGARMIFDSQDRAADTYVNALDVCRVAGGHLPSERDLTEAIRHGLPGGRNDWIWTSDLGYGVSSPNFMIVKWSDPEPDFTDLYSTYMTWAAAGALHEYRCMWTNELR